MNILVIDHTSESQAATAQLFLSIDPYQRERMALTISLVDDQRYSQRLSEGDVIVLGPALGEGAYSIARAVAARKPGTPIVRFVDWDQYGESTFQYSHSAGIRKVFSSDTSPLDILQELIAIRAEATRDGRGRDGRLIGVIGSGGGSGVTSVAAALGEMISHAGKRVLLWDTDVESAGLSRGLLSFGDQGRWISAWISGESRFSHETFESALVEISSCGMLMMPPQTLIDAEQLSQHGSGMQVMQRMIDCAKVQFDVTILDLPTLSGEAWRLALAQCDRAVLVVPGTVLGTTGLARLNRHIGESGIDQSKLVVVANRPEAFGSRMGDAVREVFRSGFVPPIVAIPHDERAGGWPGTNQTLWSAGRSSTRAALHKLASELRLSEAGAIAPPVSASKVKQLFRSFEWRSKKVVAG